MASPSKNSTTPPTKRPPPPPAPTPPAHDEDFSKVVAESKAAILNAELPPVKHKGGARPGAGRPKVSGGPPGAPGTGTIPGTATAPPDITKDLIGPITGVSTIIAAQLNVKELAFSPEEAHACAHSLNNILVAFAPTGQFNPKTAAIFGALVTFGSIGFTKYAIYVEKCKPPVDGPPEIKVEIAKPGTPPPIEKPDEVPKIPADPVSVSDYLKKR